MHDQHKNVDHDSEAKTEHVHGVYTTQPSIWSGQLQQILRNYVRGQKNKHIKQVKMRSITNSENYQLMKRMQINNTSTVICSALSNTKVYIMYTQTKTGNKNSTTEQQT